MGSILHQISVFAVHLLLLAVPAVTTARAVNRIVDAPGHIGAITSALEDFPSVTSHSGCQPNCLPGKSTTNFESTAPPTTHDDVLPAKSISPSPSHSASVRHALDHLGDVAQYFLTGHSADHADVNFDFDLPEGVCSAQLSYKSTPGDQTLQIHLVLHDDVASAEHLPIGIHSSSPDREERAFHTFTSRQPLFRSESITTFSASRTSVLGSKSLVSPTQTGTVHITNIVSNKREPGTFNHYIFRISLRKQPQGLWAPMAHRGPSLLSQYPWQTWSGLHRPPSPLR